MCALVFVNAGGFVKLLELEVVCVFVPVFAEVFQYVFASVCVLVSALVEGLG